MTLLTMFTTKLKKVVFKTLACTQIRAFFDPCELLFDWGWLDWSF